MNIELFKKILKKIKAETEDKNVKIALYNWGEPTLHPDLAKFVNIGRECGFPVLISSNYSSKFNLTHFCEHIKKSSLDSSSICNFNLANNSFFIL